MNETAALAISDSVDCSAPVIRRRKIVALRLYIPEQAFSWMYEGKLHTYQSRARRYPCQEIELYPHLTLGLVSKATL